MIRFTRYFLEETCVIIGCKCVAEYLVKKNKVFNLLSNIVITQHSILFHINPVICSIQALEKQQDIFNKFFPKFWNDKTNFTRVFVTVSPRRPWDRGCGGILNCIEAHSIGVFTIWLLISPRLLICRENLEYSASDGMLDGFQSHWKHSQFLSDHHCSSSLLDIYTVAF